MSKQSTKTGSKASGGLGGNGEGAKGTASGEDRSGMMAGASELAHEAAGKVRHAAASGASTVKRQVTEVLDRQVSSGADVISQVARSTRHAADDLERDIPQLAGVIRTMADKVDTYADDLKTKSLDDLLRSASDFTRRQPAVVIGIAAMAGFMVMRMLKSASEGQNEHRSIADMGNGRSADRGYRSGFEGRMGESGDHFS